QAINLDVGPTNAEAVFGLSGADTIDGTTANWDLALYGRSNGDTLIGGSANDRLFGDAGADALDGGLGNDYLRGGLELSGGTEADHFVFNDRWGNDRVFDFADNGLEKIDLSGVAGIDEIGDLTITDGVGYARIAYVDTVSAAWSASIRVDGVTAAELGTDDFIFV
ncbi:MAG: hypothetical protein KDJ77_15045, partial [Rhodobiaceae bacterium]|nr:hypothetical protein [Rhodobiaceae bacterium]